MTTLFHELNGPKYAAAQRRKCGDQGCKVTISNDSRCIILKGEKLLEKGQNICDCIIFNGKRILLVELKGRHPKPSDVRAQLEGDIEKSLSIISKLNNKNKFEFCPILVARHYSAQNRRTLNNMTVLIHGKKYPIILLKCGCSLEKYL